MGLEAGAFAMMAASSLAEGYMQKSAMDAKANYDEAMGDINSRFSMMRADDALKRGDEAVTAYRQKVANISGTQRANLAAQGIALDDGTALHIQESTAEIAARDVATMRNNAWRESFGFEVDAMNQKWQGRMSAVSARAQGDAAFLTGGMRAMTYGMQAASKSGWFGKKTPAIDQATMDYDTARANQ